MLRKGLSRRRAVAFLGLAGEMHLERVMDKAAKYDALQAGKDKVARMIAGKPKVVRPGAKQTSQAQGQAAVRSAHAKLKSSGNLADAVALLRTLRGKGRAG